uniref:Uncharacterized protein n=1 Tax=Mucochytrium quahogii TaxID=96639 RepID=A0A7S2WK39_9STRA|mmetsp:Transcript_26153/g.57049  ORF Transcript_26153/g.57049 Transcript_26153/m.57049 type:complete len:835 (+) Transcript_26153:44-2548(+)
MRRRHDCTGNLYIRIHGGYIKDGYLAWDRCSARDVRAVSCTVGFDTFMESADIWGEMTLPEDEKVHQQVMKSESTSDRWWFGSLASACRKGANCPDPAGCKYCTRKEPRLETAVPDEDVKKPNEKLFNRVLKSHHLWKRFRWNRSSAAGEAPRARTKHASDSEFVLATFKSVEMVLPVKDYFGRLGISFKVSFNDGSGEVNIGFGKTHLANALSYVGSGDGGDEIHFNKQQVIRLTQPHKRSDPSRQVVGCLLLEMCFIPNKVGEKEENAPYIHDATLSGQCELVNTILHSLRRKNQTLALTKRHPGYHNMNPYELATFSGQNKVLQVLLGITSTSTWNQWNTSTSDGGRSALHIAVAANNGEAIQMIAMSSYKYELPSSLFESSASYDSLSDLSGFERIRSAILNNDRDSILKFADEQGRTPFALACTLDSSIDAVPIVMTLLEFDQDITSRDIFGNTPLVLATMARQRGVIHALLNLLDEGPPGKFSCRAKPNMPNNDGVRALHIACEQGNTSVVQALLDAGALPSLLTKDGTLPLHLAAKNGHLETVQALLEWPHVYAAKKAREYKSVEESSQSNIEVGGSRRMPRISGFEEDLATAIAESLAGTTVAREDESNLVNPTNGTIVEADSVPLNEIHDETESVLSSLNRRKRDTWVVRVITSPFRAFSKKKKGAQVREEQQEQENRDVEMVAPPHDRANEEIQQAEAEEEEDPVSLHEDLIDMFDGRRNVSYTPVEDEVPQQKRGVLHETISPAEALAIRRPGVCTVQWHSGKTAAELAKDHGHDELFEILSLASKIEHESQEAHLKERAAALFLDKESDDEESTPFVDDDFE